MVLSKKNEVEERMYVPFREAKSLCGEGELTITDCELRHRLLFVEVMC